MKSGIFKDIVDRVAIAARSMSGVIVEGVNLDAPEMSVFAVLVILKNLHLHNPGDEGVSIRVATGAGNRNLLPSRGIFEGHGSKLNEVVLACAGLENNLSREMLEIITLELLYAVAGLVAADCKASEV
ncbi:hypothetical protein HG530_012112 [Fusarium avenaceum]|nr:hypothetical protein HG530_012112 [Fusarium avenaceum]